MKAIVQRVTKASVEVEAVVTASIEHGMLVYVGVAQGDEPADVDYLVEKVRYLRIFEDDASKMNLDVLQAGGQVLAVSAFTVQADARKGRRPSFDAAARGDDALKLYEMFCEKLVDAGVSVSRGVFAAHMKVRSVNDGPVCVLLDSKRAF